MALSDSPFFHFFQQRMKSVGLENNEEKGEGHMNKNKRDIFHIENVMAFHRVVFYAT